MRFLQRIFAIGIVAVAATATTYAEWLVYWDRSATTEFYADAIRYAAEQRGESVTYVSDPLELAEALGFMGWSRVFVVCKQTALPSAAVERLAGYADYYGRVEWCVVYGGDIPSASVALGSWWSGHTTLAYAGVGARDAQTFVDYHVPAFVHVRTTGLGPTNAQPMYNPIADDEDECKRECRRQFNLAKDACDDQFEEDMRACDEAYPEGSDEWETCYMRASDDHHNCMKAAIHRRISCLAACSANAGGALEQTGIDDTIRISP